MIWRSDGHSLEALLSNYLLVVLVVVDAEVGNGPRSSASC